LLVRGWFFRFNRVAAANFDQPRSREEYVEALTIGGSFEQPGIEDAGLQEMASRFNKENHIAAASGSAEGGKSSA
jgi:hypothetical protein